MATSLTPPVVQPVNRLLGLLPPPGKYLSRPAPAQPDRKCYQACPEEDDPEGVLASLVMLLLALVALTLLWPIVFGALVLLLVGLTPFVVIGAGLRAILRHERRAAR
jgi:hypothetical protein